MYEITTQRLMLRNLINSDAEALYAIRSNPKTFQYVEGNPYVDIDRAARFIKNVKKDIETGEVHFWGIQPLNGDKIIGTVCLWNFENMPIENQLNYLRAEIGYEVHPDHWGTGYANEAVAGMIVFAKTQMPIHTLIAITHKDNLASIALLKKQAFVLKGVAKEVDPEIDEGPEMMLYELKL